MKWDINVAFYIELKQQSGHAFHVSHTKIIDPSLVALPTRLLTSDEIDNIVHIVNATSNNGSGCNFVHGKFGKFISLMKWRIYVGGSVGRRGTFKLRLVTLTGLAP